MKIPVLTLSFNDIKTAKILHQGENTEIICVGDMFPLCITYGKHGIIIRTLMLGTATGIDQNPQGFQSTGTIIARLPALRKKWNKDPSTRLIQLADFLQAHQTRTTSLLKFLTQAIGEMEIPQKPHFLYYESKGNKLRLSYTQQKIPYTEQFIEIAKQTFLSQGGRWRPFLKSRIYITPKKPTSHERLELEQNIQSLLNAPTPSP